MSKCTRVILLWLTIFLTVSGCGSDQDASQPAANENKQKEPTQTSEQVTGQSTKRQIKAVHYFSSSWPIAFWDDFEKSQVDADFAQIKADGFNTIILVIPWMGFEVGFEDLDPQPSNLYERLEWLLTKVDEAGLDYGVRVSFPHSFDPAVGANNYVLCMQMFVDDELRSKWFEYLGRITQRIDQHRDSFKFAFFSWEDFFCPYVSFPAMDLDRRLNIAKKSGYQDWLAKYYPRPLIDELYESTFDSMESVPIPVRESPAFGLFFRFIDQFLVDQLVMPGREVLPELAMEVRVDKDLVHHGDKPYWAEHDLALSDTQLRGSYWGAYYGAKNQGELLTAEEALRNFEHMLNEVSDYGKNINHIVEQFNFADNTPGFVERHAQIDVPEIPAFLQGAAQLLKQKSRGYGLWAYRDYPDTAIYNSSFELGIRGWDVQDDVNVITNDDGDLALHMRAGAEISQTFEPYERFIGLTPSEQVTLCANFKYLADPAKITLSLNETTMATIEVGETSRQCAVMDAQPFKQSKIKFAISSDGDIEVDDLQLYSFVQKLNVYDQNGQPGPLRDLIVRFNKEWLNDDN